MLELNASDKIDGVFYLTTATPEVFEEKEYISVRKTEERFYPDSIVKYLPSIEPGHSHADEWLVRKKSFEKLLQYIQGKNYQVILEVGCGNGWLSNRIASKTDCLVVGLDLNQVELKQAARVFGNSTKLIFVYGNIFEKIFPLEVFDIIIFASSIQYFRNLYEVILAAFRFLKPNGEIHIIDSKFYNMNEVEAARKRTENYYCKLGFPDMAKSYFHHSWEEFNGIKYHIINLWSYNFYKKTRFLNKFRMALFPWIRVTK